jgi:hypothetical protein
VSAVQHLESAFCDPELRRGTTRPGWLGLPAFASGQNAVVFPIDLPGGNLAVKCFTGGTAEQRRYEGLATHLKYSPCPVLADAIWYDEGIEVNTDKWPIVTMPWLSGKGLHEFVASSLDQSDRLKSLASRWRAAVGELGRAKIAHGDLQHGNVIIGSRSAIHLVDYDGVWVDEIADLPPSEVGQPNYQHPERIHTGAWGQKIDTFSALVIYLSLLALAGDPDLWPDYNNGENLILTADDYLSPAKAPIWKRLDASPDPDIVELSQLLQRCCKVTVNLGIDLATILDSRQIPNAKPWAPEARRVRDHWWDDATEKKPREAPTAKTPDPPRPPTRAPSRRSSKESIGTMLIVLGICTIGISLLTPWAVGHRIFASDSSLNFTTFRLGLRSAGQSTTWLDSFPNLAAVALVGVLVLTLLRRLGPEIALALSVPLSSLGYFIYAIYLFHYHPGPGPWIAAGGIFGTLSGILIASHDQGTRFRHANTLPGTLPRTPTAPTFASTPQPPRTSPGTTSSLWASTTGSGTSFATPAAWHPDPTGRFELRYWDGQKWTDHVSTQGTQGSDPV